MSYPSHGLDTPGRHDQTQRSLDDLDLGSIAASFTSPGLDKNPLQNMARNKQRGPTRSLSTPLRPTLAGGNRGLSNGKEFTPLLKSIHMSAMKSKLRNRMLPDSPIPDAEDGDETFRSGSTTGMKVLDSSSIASTPASNLRTIELHRRGGRRDKVPQVLQTEGQRLTLREQERMIDEVQRENFDLKMKMVLLQDKLGRLPVGERKAIEENIEIKVEKEGLKSELRKAKKSLSQSEKAIAELRREMGEMESKADSEYRSGMRGEEADRILSETLGKLEEKERELEEILDENDRLREEADGLFDKVNRIEHGERVEKEEEIRRLRNQVDELNGEKADLDGEVRRVEREKEELADELDAANHDLKEKELELKEMQLNKNREVGEKERQVRELERENREVKSQVERLREEKAGLEGNMDGALKTAHARIDSLQEMITGLQTQLQKETSAKAEVIEERERFEERVSKLGEEKRQLELKYEQMEDEKDALVFDRKKLEAEKQKAVAERDGLEDDLETLRDELRNKSFSFKSRVSERDEARKGIQQELATLKQEYDDLHEMYEEKVGECERLERRLTEVGGEFDGEVQTLQDKLDVLQHERDVAVKAQKELEGEVRKVKNELHNVTSEMELLQHRHDALTSEASTLQRDIAKLKANVREAQSALQHERETAAANEQTLQEEWKADSDRLTEALERARAAMEERRQQTERLVADWNLEKRQLQARAEKAEVMINSLQNTIDQLRQMEHGLQGKEAKVHQAFHDERERHHAAEQTLNRQIKDLQEEIAARKGTLEAKISELNGVREELRQSKKGEKALEEKIRLLDDEIEVLSAQLDEAGEDNNKDLVVVRAECEALRKKLAATKAELTRAENENAHAKADMQNIKVDLEAEMGGQNQLKIQLQEANRRLDGMQREKKLLQEQLSKVQTQAHAIRTTAMDIEAERDELLSQLKDLHGRVDITKNVDTEKMELRKAKSKLELDLQRIRDERGLYAEKAQQLEADLEEAFTNATREQAKLEKQVWDLQTQLKSAVEMREREVLAAKRNVDRLERRVSELTQADGGHDSGLDLELATVREHLAEARRRESEVVQRESQSKKAVRELRMKVDKLERELSEAQNELAMKSTVGASFMNTPGGRKAEVEELRRQLAEAQGKIREFRTQVKSLERAATSQKSAYEKLEYEKQLLEQEVNDCRSSNDELVQKNLDASGTIGTLRHKILQLEKGLNDAKINKHLRSSEATRSVQQQVAEERAELHQHLKQATLEIEQLQTEVESRNEEIRSHLKRQRELESQLRGVKRDKDRIDADVQMTANELRKIQGKYVKAKEKMGQMQLAWDNERKVVKDRIRAGVIGGVGARDGEVETLEKAIQESETRHLGELRGLARQIRYLKAKVEREKGFRMDLSFVKSFFLMQINLYSSCNEANLQMIEQMGIFPDRTIREKRPTLRAVAKAVMAAIRIKKRKQGWDTNKEMQVQLTKTLEKQRRRGSARVVDLRI
ncbi:hypothetical protein L211DRAFT_836189 [Terfezia boudieri ATCC MYA-4762]|uniref:Pericentrin/AKAP-450 centrosomal targeting domain-containing protein n=1 Tax=Terfezia boudieri ATCC MYA-4762 TaxID=1051890 RepID=A0A3N4M5H5_9PEZI|nr:hypothetical protein L211DRAFT_836189 [Terfezia boudieri ATCC MYA-4762]